MALSCALAVSQKLAVNRDYTRVVANVLCNPKIVHCKDSENVLRNSRIMQILRLHRIYILRLR